MPGGKAVYPSSVIMNVVPAQAAGVESLAIATLLEVVFSRHLIAAAVQRYVGDR